MHKQSFYWQPNLENSKNIQNTHTYMYNIIITNNLKLQRTLKQSHGDPNYYSAWSDKLQNNMHYLQHWTTQPVIQLCDTIRESTAVQMRACLHGEDLLHSPQLTYPHLDFVFDLSIRCLGCVVVRLLRTASVAKHTHTHWLDVCSEIMTTKLIAGSQHCLIGNLI